MDQKRAMLYPPIDSSAASNIADHNERMSAIGLPKEAPPSYDMAIASTSDNIAGPSTAGWQPSAPEAVIQAQPSMPALPEPSYNERSGGRKHRHQRDRHANDRSRPVIVEQPTAQPQPQPQLPTSHPLPATVISAIPPKLGPNPCAVTCPTCGANKTTRMSFTPNNRTHLSALVLCLVGWCCCACLVPYCMNSCRTGNHYCSKCNTFLGTYNPRAKH